MNTGEDEPSSGLNGRLRPRKSNTIAIPSPVGRSSRKTERLQDKQKRTSTLASPNKPDDLNKSDPLPELQLLCPYCDKRFASKVSTAKHVRRSHLSSSKRDEPIGCLLCSHSEAEPNDIIRHMVDSHPNQYFACLNCHTRFPSTSDLAEHKLNVCEKQKPAYSNKLRQKSSSATRKNKKRLDGEGKNAFPNENKGYMGDHGFNGIVISCELKPSQTHDVADIEDNITTNLILPPSKALGNSGLEKNAVIVLDDIQWNKRIPSNFAFHNTDSADQILSRLGVVHRSPRVGETTRRAWFKMVDENSHKFEKCFDTNFYTKVASNVQENIARFLDGSFNFNPDPDLNIIKTRKSKSNVVINTAEGFPILLAYEQYSRNLFEGYIPRALAPKHKWKWDSNENEDNTLIDPNDIKRDNHVNNCIITLVSSLDIWTQLCMRRKFEAVFSTTSSDKTDKHNIISNELKEILESREIPTTSSQIIKYNSRPPVPTSGDKGDFPSFLGLTPTQPTCEVQPAVLSGEWVRPRCYVCCACGAQTRDSKGLTTHMSTQHPNAQVQHYEIVGEPLLNADIFKHLYVPPNQISNRTRPPRGFRDCTKCKKSVTLEDLHQHMLDCAGDTPAVRRKCRYRPFGVRRRRTRLPDNKIRKNMRKEIRSRHRQKGHMRQRPKIRTEVGDAETIRKMIADLPAKRHRVVVNSSTNLLRPRRKIETQRAKLNIKRQISDDTNVRRTRSAKEAGSKTSDADKKQVDSANTDEDDKPLKPSTKSDVEKSQNKEVSSDKNPLSKTRKIHHTEKRENKLRQRHSIPIKLRPMSILEHQMTMNNTSLMVNVNSVTHDSRQQSDNNQTDNSRQNHEPPNMGAGSSDGADGSASNADNTNKNDNAAKEKPAIKHSIARITSSDGYANSTPPSCSYSVNVLATSNHQEVEQRQVFENETGVVKLHKPPLQDTGNDQSYSEGDKGNKSIVCPKKLSKPRKGLKDCIAMLRDKVRVPSNVSDSDSIETIDLFLPKNIDVPDVPEPKNSSESGEEESQRRNAKGLEEENLLSLEQQNLLSQEQETVQGTIQGLEAPNDPDPPVIISHVPHLHGGSMGIDGGGLLHRTENILPSNTGFMTPEKSFIPPGINSKRKRNEPISAAHSSHYPDHYFYKKGKRCESRIQRNSCDEPVMASHQFTKPPPRQARRNSYMESDVLSQSKAERGKTRRSQRTESVGGNETEARNPCADPMKYTGYYLGSSLRNVRRNSYDGRIPSASDYYFPPQLASVVNSTIMPGTHNLQDPLINHILITDINASIPYNTSTMESDMYKEYRKQPTRRSKRDKKHFSSVDVQTGNALSAQQIASNIFQRTTEELEAVLQAANNNNTGILTSLPDYSLPPGVSIPRTHLEAFGVLTNSDLDNSYPSASTIFQRPMPNLSIDNSPRETRRSSSEIHNSCIVPYANLDCLTNMLPQDLAPLTISPRDGRGCQDDFNKRIPKQRCKERTQSSIKSSDSSLKSTNSTVTSEIYRHASNVPDNTIAKHLKTLAFGQDNYQNRALENEYNTLINKQMHLESKESLEIRGSLVPSETQPAEEEYLRSLQYSRHECQERASFALSEYINRQENDPHVKGNKETYTSTNVEDNLHSQKSFPNSIPDMCRDLPQPPYSESPNKSNLMDHLDQMPMDPYMYRQNTPLPDDLIEKQKTMHITDNYPPREGFSYGQVGVPISYTHSGPASEPILMEPLDLSGRYSARDENQSKYLPTETYPNTGYDTYETLDLSKKPLAEREPIVDLKHNCPSEFDQVNDVTVKNNEDDGTATDLSVQNTQEAKFDHEQYNPEPNRCTQESIDLDIYKNIPPDHLTINPVLCPEEKQENFNDTMDLSKKCDDKPLISIDTVPQDEPLLIKDDDSSSIADEELTKIPLPTTPVPTHDDPTFPKEDDDTKSPILFESHETIANQDALIPSNSNYYLTTPLQNSIVNTTVEISVCIQDSINMSKVEHFASSPELSKGSATMTTTTNSVTGVVMTPTIETKNNLSPNIIEAHQQDLKISDETSSIMALNLTMVEPKLEMDDDRLDDLSSDELIDSDEVVISSTVLFNIVHDIPLKYRPHLIEILPKNFKKLVKRKRAPDCSAIIIPLPILKELKYRANNVAAELMRQGELNNGNYCDTTTIPNPLMTHLIGMDYEETHSTVMSRLRMQSHFQDSVSEPGDFRPLLNYQDSMDIFLSDDEDDEDDDFIIDHTTGEYKPRPLSDKGVILENVVIDLTVDGPDIPSSASPILTPEVPKAVKTKSASEQTSVLRAVRIRAPSERKSLSDLQNVTLGEKEDKLITNAQNILNLPQNIPENPVNVTSPIEEISKLNESAVLPTNLTKQENINQQDEIKSSSLNQRQPIGVEMHKLHSDNDKLLENTSTASAAVLDDSKKIKIPPVVLSTVTEETAISTNLLLSTAHEKQYNTKNLELAQNNDIDRSKTFDIRSVSSHVIQDEISPTDALKDNNGKQDDGRTEDKTSAKLLIKIPKLDLSSGISGEALQSEDSDDDVSLAVIVRQKQRDLLTVADSNLPTPKEICSSKHKKKHKKIKQKPLKASNTENSTGHVSNKVKKALHHKIAKRTKSLVIYSENVTEMKLTKKLTKKSKSTHIEDNFNVKENNVFDHIPNQDKDTLNINPNEEDIHTNIDSNNMPTFQNPMEDVTEARDQKIKVTDTNEIRNLIAEIKENVNQIDVESEDHPLQEEINTLVTACNLEIPHNVNVHPDQLDGMSKKKRKSRTKTKNIARIESPENSSFSAEVCDTVVTLRRSSRRKSVFFDSNSQNESDIIETDDSTLEHPIPFTKKQSIFSRMAHDEVPEQDAEIVTEKERDENDVVSEKKKFRSNKRKKSPHTKRKNKKKKCHEDNTISAAMDQDKEKNEVDINESSLINDQLHSEINRQETEIITDVMSSAEKRKLTAAHNKDSSRAKKSKLNEKFDVLTCEIDTQSLKVSDNTVQGELDCTQSEDPTNTEGKKRTESGSETRSTCYNRRVENSLVKYGPTFSSKTSDNYDPYDIDFEDMIEESGPKVKPPQRKSRNNHKSSHGGKQYAVNNMQSTIKLNAQASTSPEHKDLKTQDSKSKEIDNTSNNSSDSDSSKSDVPLQKYVEDKEKRRMGIQVDANKKTIKSNEENHLTLQKIDQSEDKEHVLETLDKLEIVPDNKIAMDEAKKDEPMKDCIELDKNVIEPQDQTPNITCEASTVILKEVVIDDSDPQQTQTGVEVVRSENGRRDKEKESLPDSQIETVAVMPTEDEQRSEKFMENFGFFSERKPRKSNLLASKKISETFHMIANDDDTYHKGKDRSSRKHSHSKSLENTPTTKMCQDSASLPCNDRNYIIPSTIKRDAREMEAAIELDTLSTGINEAANNMMESEEIRILENDLITCLREAAEAKSNQSQKDKYQLEEGSLTNLPEEVIERPSPIIEEPFKDPSNECFEIVKKVPKIKIRPPGYKEKMYPDIEEIDLFEDKFDKIKRKCRSQAAAAKQTPCVIESITGKSRKKPDKKSKKKGSSKNTTILTKGAMKVFDGIKISIPTHDLNMPPNLSPPRIHKKRKSGSKKKRERFDTDSSRYDSKSNLKESLQEKDVYEFMDTDDTELLELRPSTVMDRFRSLSKEKTKSKDKHRDRDNKEKESSDPKIDESYEEYREAKRKPKLRPSFDERTKEDVKDKVEDIDKIEHLTDVSKVNESDEKTCLAPKQREEKEKSLDDDLFKKPSNAIRYLGRRVDTKEKYDENDGGDDAEEFDDDKDSTERSIPGPSGFVPDSNEDSSFDWSGSSDADYVYMSDGYGCSCMSDSEDSESEKGCDNNSCPYRKKNAEKNAVMGKIFKNNAVRREKNVSKPKEPVKPDLDQLFDSLLASNSIDALGQKGKGALSSCASPSQEVFTTPPTSPEARVISSRHDSIHTGSQYTTPTEIITPKNTRSSQNSSKDESCIEDLFASDLDCNQTNKTDCIDQYVMMSSKSIQSEDPEVVLQNAPPINSIILEQNKTDDESDTEADDFIVLKRIASMTANSTQTEVEHAEVIVSDDDDDSYMDCSVNDDLNINSPPRGNLVMMSIKSTQTDPKKHKSHKSRHENLSPPAEVAGPSLSDIPCKDFLVAKKFVTSASRTVQTDHSKLKSRKHSKHYDSGDGEGKRSKDKASKRAHRAESKSHHRSSTSDEDLNVLKHEAVLPFTVEETRREKLSSPFRLSDDGTGEDNIDSFERAVHDDAGVARQRARRKCTVGKQNVLAEHWSSESEPDGAPVRPTSADSLAAGVGRRRKGKRREGHQSSGKRGSRHGKKHEGEGRVSSGSRAGTSGRSARAESGGEESGSVSRGAPLGPKIRARPAHAHYWSSDGEEDAGAPPQHGWIVGDSHKKLVTMLANAKGRKRHNDDKRTLEE